MVAVTTFRAVSTIASNDTDTNVAGSQREARYSRHEKPLILLRPSLQTRPIEPMLMQRQFVGAPQSGTFSQGAIT